MKTIHYIGGLVISSLCLLGTRCTTDYPSLGASNKIEHDKELRLKIQAPNDVVLRSTSTQVDPMLKISSLRLVFYQNSNQADRVSVVRDLAVGASSSDIRVKVPQGEYKLVAIANPTSRLIELTRQNSPITNLTQGSYQSSGDLRAELDGVWQISMLNAQGPVEISEKAFEPDADIQSISVEPTMARVLVYGEPDVVNGKKGESAAKYVISNLSKEMSYLRMLNKLSDGTTDEVLGDNSKRADRYASCKYWNTWASTTPQSTEGVAHFTESLYQKMASWQEVKRTVEEFNPLLATNSTLYCKEGVVPEKAYLQGLVPSVVLAFPYIPDGLTLSSNEGWVEYHGRVYSEGRVKEMIRSMNFDDNELGQAIAKAKITESSFSKAFDKEQVRFYYKAINYYSIPIRHFASASEESTYGRYGVVRGNEYRIKLLKITQMGASVPILFEGNISPIEEAKGIGHNITASTVEIRNQEAEL